MKKLFQLLLLLAVVTHGFSATKYVAPGASGSGASWSTPASTSIINSSSAGDIIYLGGGSYGNGIAVSVSGNSSSPVTIKRATSADHGADTGWAASMDAQAVFTSGWLVTGSNITIDGNKWKPPGLPTVFGIKISHGSGAKGIDAGGSGGGLKVVDVDVSGPGINSSKAEADGIHFPSNATISGCAVHDTDVLCFAWKGNSGSTFEYCLLYNASSNIVYSGNPQDPHPDVIYSGSMLTNGVMRWCVVANVTSEGVFFDSEIPNSGSMEFYGNIMWQGDCQTGNTPIQLQNGAPFGPVKLYNNTFVDFNKSNNLGPGTTTASGSACVNNLFINYLPNWNVGVNNNGFSSTGIGTGQIINAANPFTTTAAIKWVKGSANAPATRVTTGAPIGYNPSGMEVAFALASDSWANGKGIAVPAGRNTDLYGNTGSNLGAIQGAGSAPSPTPTPAPTATPTPTPGPSPTPPKFVTNDWVTPRADAVVNVRSTPAGTLVGSHAAPEVGVVISGPTAAALNGVTVQWYKLDWTNGVDGWSGDDDLVKTTAPTPTPTPTPAPTPTPGPSPTPTPGAPTYESWIKDLNTWIRGHTPYPDK